MGRGESEKNPKKNENELKAEINSKK